MLFDNGIKVVKKGNTIIAQNGSSVYELTVKLTEDEALNPICYHGEANVKVHGESEKETITVYDVVGAGNSPISSGHKTWEEAHADFRWCWRSLCNRRR